MNKKANRALRILLALIMIVGLLPISAFAEGDAAADTGVTIESSGEAAAPDGTGNEIEGDGNGVSGEPAQGDSTEEQPGTASSTLTLKSEPDEGGTVTGGDTVTAVTVEVTSDYDGATYVKNPDTGKIRKIAFAGDIVTYTITVHSTGNDPAENIVTEVTYPDSLVLISGDLRESIQSLDPTDSYSKEVRLLIKEMPAAGETIEVTATARCNGMQEAVSATNKLKVKYSIITSAEPAEGGSITAPLLGVEGEQTISYAPNQGYRLKSLTLDGKTLTVSDYPDSYTFAEVTKDYFFTAEFAEAYDLADVSVQQTGTLTYSGNPQTANVTASATAVNNENVTFTYSAEQNGTYTAEVPAFTDAGTHTVYYKASAADHNDATGSFVVTVKPKTITEADFTALPTETRVYNGKPQTQEIASSTLTEGTDYRAFYRYNTFAGSATYSVEGINNYTGVIGKTFIINKADPTVTDVSVTSPTTVYDTTAIEDIVLGFTDDPTGGSIELNDGQTLTVGTKDYNWTYTPKDTDNYNTVTGTVSITVMNVLDYIEITTKPSKLAYKYGEPFDKTGMVVTATFKNGDKTTPTDLTFTPDGKLGMSDTTVTVKYVYDGMVKTATQSITVAKADAPAFADENFSMKYSSGANTYNLALAAKPADAQNVIYALGTMTTTGSGSADAAINNGGKLTVTTSGFAAADVGKTITIPVTFSSENYADATFKVVITLTDKDVPTVSANDITVTYTGNPVADSQIQGIAKFGSVGVQGSWAFKTGETVTDVAHSGTKAVVFTPNDAVNYAAVETTLTLTINKADPTVTDVSVTSPTTVYDTTAIEDIVLGFTDDPTGGSIELNDGQTLTVGTKDYNWTYTPKDTDNYNTVTGTVSITVEAKTNPPQPSTISYAAKDGSGNTIQSVTWQKGSGKNLDLTFKRSEDDHLTYGLFASLEIGGQAVGSANYGAEEGSLKLSIKPEYLETLSVGDHTVKVNFQDGSATVKLTVKAAATQPTPSPKPSEKPTSPKTGDESNLVLWSSLMFLSVAAMIVLLLYARKRKTEK